MKKPHETVCRIYEMGFIHKIEVRYEMTGVDTAETYIVMTSLNGDTLALPKATFLKYMQVSLGYNSIAVLKPEFYRAVTDWKNHVANNEADYTKYLQLRKKFEDV